MISRRTCALFVSDVHLQESMPRTAEAFLRFLRDFAAVAERLYILGDLFEYWAGDDDLLDAFNQKIVGALRAVSDAGTATYWIGGNRDFLVNTRFLKATGLTSLPDGHVELLANQRIILAHGDAQCTDDSAYMAFRAQVRQPEWQEKFLSMPLEARKAVIVGMRNSSQEAQRKMLDKITDVNPQAIFSLFKESGAAIMIHGHTHRPARHEYADGHVRYVLPDWDCEEGSHIRGGWISLRHDGTIEQHNSASEV